MSDYLDPANEEMLKDFFEEAFMQVDILEQNIIVLEKNPDNKESVDEIFRAAHTLKGGAATVEMTELAEFTHIIEDVLDKIRSSALKVNEEVIDSLLKAIDITKAMVQERSEGGIFEEDVSDIIKTLNSFLSEEKPEKQETKAISEIKLPDSRNIELSEYELLELQAVSDSDNPIIRVRVQFNEDNPMNTIGGIQVFALLNKSGKILKTEPEFDELNEDVFHPMVDYYLSTEKSIEEMQNICVIPDVILKTDVSCVGLDMDTESGSDTADEEEKAAEKKEEEPEAEKKQVVEKSERKAAKKTLTHGSVLRVDSNRIDTLLNLVGETVIIKAAFNQMINQFNRTIFDMESAEVRYRQLINEFFDTIPEYLEKLNNGSTLKDIKKIMQKRFEEIYEIFELFEGSFKSNVTKFRSNSQILSRITGELQEGVMKIRMVPIAQLFSRFPRLVRDLTKTLKKKINLVIEGEDTELDKSIIEDILDPLIHCVRNSIDHGIEVPADRKKAGKDEQGEIRLSARNEGSMIIITISDDGKGIDVGSVRKKAIDRGLIHPNKALTDIEAFNLIFEPGFSTAGKVTNISGRGVGLDVVRRQVEKLNGTVSIWSEIGSGTTFTIKLPLTLAIIQGLLVKVGKEIYIIPINSIIESLRIRPGDINLIDNYEVFNLRDDVLSLLRLDRLFHIDTEQDKPYLFVVVVGIGEKKVGLVIDSLIGEEDVVIKPLRNRYANSPGIAGATILGDGTVSLILDVGQLLELGLKQKAKI